MSNHTPLHDVHVAAGAKMTPFAGWEMPVQYKGILDEVRAVRSVAGIFDVSHMGEVRVTGDGALAAVQALFTNDAAKIAPGRAQYTLMCRDDGGILDDLIVYRCDNGAASPEFLVVVNASNRETDFDWMTTRAPRTGAAFEDVSSRYALLAVQGPHAPALVQSLAPDADIAALPPFAHTETGLRAGGRGAPVRLARTGYTGEDGFEIFCGPDDAAAVWEAVVSAGAAPCGLGARDVLRIEASYPLYGHEINERTNPYEAGLGWVVKPKKGDYIGREAMLAARQSGLARKLCGVLPDEPRAIPRDGVTVLTDAGEGRITSGTFSPTLNRAIGIAYVPVDAMGRARLSMRGREMPAELVGLPFYRRARD